MFYYFGLWHFLVFKANYSTRGVYSSSNVFTAQLSNSSGSFGSPVSIGTLSTATSGSFSCVIPSNTPSGTGYRIRIVSNLPSVISNVNGSNLRVNLNPTASSSVMTPISCYGGNGIITVTATGGSTPYSGTGSNTVDMGSYSYTVTDSNGCTSTTTRAITQPTLLVASSSNTAINCYGASSVITVSASGGTIGYTGPGTHAVLAGTYSYTVTDAKGCTSSISTIVSQPAQLLANATSTSIAYYGGTSTITVSGSGGTANYTDTGNYMVPIGTYTYTISDAHSCTATKSITIIQPTALTAVSVAGSILCYGGTTTLTVSGSGGNLNYVSGTGVYTVGLGTYTYTVTDARGCTASTAKTITQPSTLGFSTSVTNLTGCGVSTGSITVNAVGGTGTKTYSKDNGVTFQSANLFGSLATGNYFVAVKDANLCLSPRITTVVGTNTPVTFTTSIMAPSPCTSAKGRLTITAAGGSGTYNYSIDNGTTFQATNVYSSLLHTTYVVKVRDANLCITAGTNVTVDPACREGNLADGIKISNEGFIVYPNPANIGATILFTSDDESSYKLNLIDITGRTIFTANVTSEIGDNQYQLNLADYSKGIYMVSLQNNQGTAKKKLIIE